MKTRRTPDKSDLDAIRAQILSFACDKHDFALEADEFLPAGDWYGVFMVKIKGTSREDRLYCEAPMGEYFIRFGLDLVFCSDIWESQKETIIQYVSKYDIALYPDHLQPDDGKKQCRLYSRAWIINFNQRIFGLTLSNLLDCKEAIVTSK